MNIDIFLQSSPAVIIHTLVAFIALGLGVTMFVRRKGTPSHKVIGRLFILFMAVTAISALFIRMINDGRFSFIHLFIPLTFFAIWETIHFVRKGNIRRHTRAVKGLFFGALMIPGILSFLPGRTMWHVFFGG